MGLIKRGNVIIDCRFISRDDIVRGIELYRNESTDLTNDEYLGTLSHVYDQKQFILDHDVEK